MIDHQLLIFPSLSKSLPRGKSKVILYNHCVDQLSIREGHIPSYGYQVINLRELCKACDFNKSKWPHKQMSSLIACLLEGRERKVSKVIMEKVSAKTLSLIPQNYLRQLFNLISWAHIHTCRVKSMSYFMTNHHANTTIVKVPDNRS